MTNTLAIKQSVSVGSIAVANIASTVKQQTKLRLRRMLAVALFIVAGFGSAASGLDFAFAKTAVRRVANKMREVKGKGEFRLLNFYNSMKESNPAFIQTMNSATQGLASWYGGMFHGRKTAMGTTYNMYAMTAAHRSLPLGTWVKVTNEENGKSAIVQVTDRGPYVANRIMDLSYAAAKKLGYANAGTTNISMKVLGSNVNVAMNQETSDATAVRAAQPKAEQRDEALLVTDFSRVSTRTSNVVMSQTDSSANVLDVLASLASDAVSPLFA